MEMKDVSGNSLGKRRFRIVGILNDQRDREENVQRKIDPVESGWEEGQKFTDIPKLFVSKKDLPAKYSLTGMVLINQNFSVYYVEKQLKKRKMLVVESNRLTELNSLAAVENRSMTQKELYQKAHLSYYDFYSAYAIPSFYFIMFLISFCSIYGIMSDVLLERQHQMGLLRSIGLSGKQVKKILLKECGIFCVLGITGGYLLGIAGYLLFIRMINQYSSGRIYSAFHAHVIAKAISMDPYIIPWFFGCVCCFVPICVILFREKNYSPLELLYPEKRQFFQRCKNKKMRTGNPLKKILTKYVGENMVTVIILFLTTWSLVFGCLFTMEKSDQDNIFAVEDLKKTTSVDADYYGIKDIQNTEIGNIQYNRHKEGVSFEDYNKLFRMKAVESGNAFTKMPGIKVLYDQKDMPDELKKILAPLNIKNNEEKDYEELYKKSDEILGYRDGENQYQVSTVGVDDILLSKKKAEIISGTINLKALDEGTEVLVAEYKGETKNPYRVGDKVTLTNGVITDKKIEAYDFSQNIMPKWVKPSFYYSVGSGSDKKKYPGYAFGKRLDRQVTVGAVIRWKNKKMGNALYYKSNVWNDRNTGKISPGFQLICAEKAIKKWGYPNQTYTDVYFKLKSHAAQKDVDAFEVAWYQVMGKSGKSMEGVSKRDVIQRIRRGEQANLSIFAMMIFLVVITGIFGLINAYLFAIRKNEGGFQLLRAIGVSRRKLFILCIKKKIMLPLWAALTSLIPVILFDKIRLYAKYYTFDLNHNTYESLKNGKNVICWQARFPWYIELFRQPVAKVVLLSFLIIVGVNLVIGCIQVVELKKQGIVEKIRNDEF